MGRVKLGKIVKQKEKRRERKRIMIKGIRQGKLCCPVGSGLGDLRRSVHTSCMWGGEENVMCIRDKAQKKE